MNDDRGVDFQVPQIKRSLVDSRWSLAFAQSFAFALRKYASG